MITQKKLTVSFNMRILDARLHLEIFFIEIIEKNIFAS